MGGYLSEIYLRFNLPNVENIRSMVLQLTYWDGYPIEVDDYYEINASLVKSNWVEETTVWTEKPEYLGTSTIKYLHNSNLESEIYLDLTNLVAGITETLITIRLCPNNLSRIRFPAPLESSESYGITPRLILDYSTRSKSIIPDNYNQGLIGLLILFGILCFISLTGMVYRPLKHKFRRIRVDTMQDTILPIVKQEKQTPIITDGISEPAKELEERKKKPNLCPHCGSANFKGWKFCTTCGKRMKLTNDSIGTSEFLGGFIISLIGGLLSLALGFGIPFVYPELVYYMEDLMMILQTITIIGGVVSIIGAILVFSKPKVGGTIALAGGFIAGINFITIIGAIQIFKKLKS